MKWLMPLIALGAATASLASPALADVKAGVDAWSRGDFERAVREWRAPASQGDPDALFNLAQAYRLGRGVEANTKQAELFYAQAAQKGHLKAADNYGLLLFQDGRRDEAMPYIRAAADRGDPRAQYLLGIAHFNGDLAQKDWVRAYALMTLANAAGLPQAGPGLQQMDGFIPLEQRQQAQSLASRIQSDTDARRTSQLASLDLDGAVGSTPAPAPVTVPRSVPQPVQRTDVPASVPASVAAANAAISEAQRATGTGNPANAGADYTANAGTASQPKPSTPPKVAVRTDARPAGKSPPSPAAVTRSGPWRVQLGAFSVAGNADSLWNKLSGRKELAGTSKVIVPAGKVSKLMAGGFATRADAQNACNALKRSGQDCLVTR